MLKFHAFLQLRTLIVALLGLGFASGLSGASKKLSWGPILEVLNQDPQTDKALKYPFSETSGQDLLKVYEEELQIIKNEWKGLHPKGGGSSKRKEENEFFWKKISALNRVTLNALRESAQSHQTGKKNYRAVASRVLNEATNHPVASLDRIFQYDETGQVGFCFGRALLIHYLLLKAGVKPSDIIRLFVMGELHVSNLFYHFHTAIAVRDSQWGYWVVDPLQPAPLKYRSWVDKNAAYDIKGRYSRARFYVVDPRKFLPSSRHYELVDLENPVLINYFEALKQEIWKTWPNVK